MRETIEGLCGASRMHKTEKSTVSRNRSLRWVGLVSPKGVPGE